MNRQSQGSLILFIQPMKGPVNVGSRRDGRDQFLYMLLPLLSRCTGGPHRSPGAWGQVAFVSPATPIATPLHHKILTTRNWDFTILFQLQNVLHTRHSMNSGSGEMVLFVFSVQRGNESH